MLPVDSSAWNFEEKSRFLYVYLLTKINSDMHDKTSSITSKNGFELYRLIYNSVDSIPMNAEFHFEHQLTQLTVDWQPKIKNFKDLYGFRIHLKKQVQQ